MARILTPFRLHPETKHKASQLAKMKDRSLANFVERLLDEAIRDAEAKGIVFEEYVKPSSK